MRDGRRVGICVQAVSFGKAGPSGRRGDLLLGVIGRGEARLNARTHHRCTTPLWRGRHQVIGLR
jgi:hypothetical protein